ncbi:hypothetical protein [Kitasatospora sp. NPDC094015]|uniref:hypothetical protein n=1 Tax=Kitasatospora sp. NPDC094015 TaxID=3155205 RepID=UPI003328D08B
MTDSSVPPPPARRRTERPLPGAPAPLPRSPLDRLLIQVRPERVGYVRDQVDPARSGLLVTGPRALRKVAELRRGGHAGVLLADPAHYEEEFASAAEPFRAPAGQLLLDDPLDQAVHDQLAVGADAALTPTGYLRAGDLAALTAAARRVTALDDARVVLVVPADVGWLRGDRVERFAAVLESVPGTKAVLLGGQLDPLAGPPGALASLVRLLTRVPGIALLRSDLAAFGALARGAAFTAYGAGSGLRHIVPPGEPARRAGGPTSPAVLFPELMGLFLGRTIADRYAAARVPVCRCAACGYRELDSFASNREAVPAALHNTAVLMGWLGALHGQPPGPARERWWQDRCRAAVDRYPVVNLAIGQPDAFRPPPQLRRWVELGGAAAGEPADAVPVR